eukprot:755724-Rhodomonas_salina.1
MDLCIGNEQADQCVPDLERHGSGFFEKPRVRLLETSIAAVKVRAGASTRNCRAQTALGASIQGRADSAFAAVATAANGTILSVTVTDGSVYFFPGDSVFPVDPNCKCGDGIEDLELLSMGSGYLHTADGVLFAVDGSGVGFLGRFSSSQTGTVASVEVSDKGRGYSDSVRIKACPRPSVWKAELQCCWYREWIHGSLPAGSERLVYANATGCFSNLTQPLFRFSVGLPGGVPGNFDACLDVVVDEQGCRCGSNVEEVVVVDAGAGYLDGPILLLQEESEYCVTAPADCPFDPAFCIEDWLSARPVWCELHGSGFRAQASVRSPMTNATSDMLESGAVQRVVILNGGLGYNKSYSRLALVYPELTRCDDGSGSISSQCEQTGTITAVEIVLANRSASANDSTTLAQILDAMPMPASAHGRAFASCAGIRGCSGWGFDATCSIDAGHLTFAISNHGTGFNARSPPLVWCEMDANASALSNDTVPIGRNASLGLVVQPTIAAGLELDLLQGKPSGVFDNHDSCLGIMVPNGQAEIHFGALAQLERRWLGSSLAGVSLERDLLILDKRVLENERLHWFMRAASGQDALSLKQATCDADATPRALHAHTPSQILRAIECVGTARVWGATSLLSITFFEVLELPARIVQVHLALLSIRPSSNTEWLPFEYAGVPSFDGVPTDSWVSSLGFGGVNKPAFRAYIQASTTPFNHTSCKLCRTVPRSSGIEWSHIGPDG